MVRLVELTIGKPLPKHECYDRQAQARAFWRRSDRAGWDYAAGADAGGQPILPQHERETTERYKRRLSQAIARPYQRQILDRYNDHVFRVPAKREKPEGQYGKLTADADGSGTPLHTLMKRALRKAQTESGDYLLADSNVAEVLPTAADELARGKRGIITVVNADQVLYWRDYKGLVVEALILFVDADGVEFALRVDANESQRIELKREKGQMVPQVTGFQTPVRHSYGGCPLVRLAPAFGEDDEPGESSQAAPLAESTKRICNLESWGLEETQGCTFTTTVFIGLMVDDVKNLTVGPGSAVVLEKDTAKIDKLGADTAQAEQIQARLDHEITELYRAAGLASGTPTQVAQPESGVAKAFAFNEVEAKLSALARACQDAENRVVKMLSTAGGWTYPGDAIYPQSFAIPDVAEELDYVIRLTTANLPQILKDKAVKAYASIAFALDDEESKTLDAQLVEIEQQRQEDLTTNPAERTFGT